METFEEETPNKVKKVELEIQSDKEESSVGTNSDVGELTFSLNASSALLVKDYSNCCKMFRGFSIYNRMHCEIAVYLVCSKSILRNLCIFK